MKFLLYLSLIVVLYSTSVSAIPFGTFDARSVAMGGTGVASATSANAGYYNPSLMAQYKVRKEKARNSRFMLPVINATATDNVEEVSEIEDYQFDTRFANAIDDFNNDPQDYQALLDVTNDLQDVLDSTSSEPLYADANIGSVLSVANRGQGGTFLFNMRVVADGVINYSDEDRALLGDYIEEAEYVAAGNGNLPGQLHPELYNNGELINPTDSLNSQAAATGVRMSEFSMSLAKEISLFKTKFLMGFTPKIVALTIYQFQADATDNNATELTETEIDPYFNIDFGMAKEFKHNLTAGLVIKNMIPKRFDANFDQQIRFDPQVKAGVYYRNKKWGNYALDFDVLENDAIGQGDATHMLGVGGEWGVGVLQLRGGLSKNFAGTKANKDVLYSVGLNFHTQVIIIDFSYAGNSNQTSYSFQMGSRF